MQKAKTAISPTREENYPEWYQAVLQAADLSENSPVRGCMVIKPWGFGIWEKIQKGLDGEFKRTGHKNSYFPLFIPLSFLQKEATHVEGFATECAVVTHHRLEKDAQGQLVPAGELEEPLVVRPTSEMIIGHFFSKWIQSHRDLPLLLNQWCNVVRWEMRTRMFLRTTEFLWQEGHTAHATKEEALVETKLMLQIYKEFIEEQLAIPVIVGEKTEKERFPGADITFTLEAMMQDKKGLQTATSHFLGQNFAKSCEIQFQNKEGVLEYAWTTSWGSTTRLIGALIMVHSDDDGLVLPPYVAPSHVVILPVIPSEEVREEVLFAVEEIARELRATSFGGGKVEVEVDLRDIRGGEKMWGWVKKGVPIRIEIGPKDLAKGSVVVARRDRSPKEKEEIQRGDVPTRIPSILEEIQKSLWERAKGFRDSHIVEVDSLEEFTKFFEKEDSQGFALCHWNRDPKWEVWAKETYGVTIRCIPLEGKREEGKCIFTKEKSLQRVLFAKAY